MLDRDEYVEQAYFFRALGERLEQHVSTQELLETVRQELLSTTKLPMAIEFMSTELKLNGTFAPAMARLGHYFTSFQTFVISEAESEQGRFDFGVALQILEREAQYRTQSPHPQAMFLYQFECLCRNRLGYDKGLTAISGDPIYDAAWRDWIVSVRRQIGMVEIADLIYVRSAHYVTTQSRQGHTEADPTRPPLFGEKEGKIALANRKRDPMYLFAALERHLQYPRVPRPKPPDENRQLLPGLMRRVERLETRLKLLEEESKTGAIDITKLYGPPPDLSS